MLARQAVPITRLRFPYFQPVVRYCEQKTGDCSSVTQSDGQVMANPLQPILHAVLFLRQLNLLSFGACYQANVPSA